MILLVIKFSLFVPLSLIEKPIISSKLYRKSNFNEFIKN
ncbi:hypothetical protein VCRA2113O213_350010 [Vibrio crassostreae]|nr:hypothetical protein VCRA2113O213_350010 [Vibrio crassostreae]